MKAALKEAHIDFDDHTDLGNMAIPTCGWRLANFTREEINSPAFPEIYRKQENFRQGREPNAVLRPPKGSSEVGQARATEDEAMPPNVSDRQRAHLQRQAQAARKKAWREERVSDQHGGDYCYSVRNLHKVKWQPRGYQHRNRKIHVASGTIEWDDHTDPAWMEEALERDLALIRAESEGGGDAGP